MTVYFVMCPEKNQNDVIRYCLIFSEKVLCMFSFPVTLLLVSLLPYSLITLPNQEEIKVSKRNLKCSKRNQTLSLKLIHSNLGICYFCPLLILSYIHVTSWGNAWFVVSEVPSSF